MTTSLADPLSLRCGATLPNRLAKAAMTEGLADPLNRATAAHAALYQRWAAGGAGLLLTGNVQIDRRFLERPGNVAIDGNGGLDTLRDYAAAATSCGNHCWMQINHPGRQAGTGKDTFVAPSAGTLPGGAGATRALEPAEIRDIIRRFVHVAETARATGFTGVQIHAAHGYLMSQFLSPLTNQRTDEWGGTLENRARILLEIVKDVRRAVGNDFPVSVKLNSADFQKGGLTESESIEVVRWLDAAGLDLLEISGGNYESQMMVGRTEQLEHVRTKTASTLAREAYFLEFAARLRAVTDMPLMVTGGFRTPASMVQSLADGALDVVGIGRPLCLDTDICNRLLAGDTTRLPSPDDAVHIESSALGGADELACRAAEVQSSIAFYFNQIRRLAAGKVADTKIDWLAQMDEHVQFDQAAEKLYQASF